MFHDRLHWNGSATVRFLCAARTGRTAVVTANLGEVRIKALNTFRPAYAIRDGKIKALGVRMLPSGAIRFFVRGRC